MENYGGKTLPILKCLPPSLKALSDVNMSYRTSFSSLCVKFGANKCNSDRVKAIAKLRLPHLVFCRKSDLTKKIINCNMVAAVVLDIVGCQKVTAL